MCPQQLTKLGNDPRNHHRISTYCYSGLVPFLFVIVLSLFATPVMAQNSSEEYLAVMNWVLPETAVDFNELRDEKGLMLHQETPFSGISFELYPNGKLYRMVSFHQGKQHGIMQLWYPDGTPQMSANYRNGALHGRFLGWYQNGGVIYDMMINKGAYAGDSLLDADDSRRSAETVETDKEGSDNDQSPE